MYLLVNSANRLSNSISSTDFFVNCDRLNDKLGFSSMRILRVYINGSFYNINSTNKYLTISYYDTLGNDYENTISLPDGNYDVNTLKTKLQQSIRDESGLLSQFTIEYDAISNKYTFKTNNTTTFQFNKSVFNNSLLPVLGFENKDTLVANIITATHMVDFSGYDNFYVRCPSAGLNVYSDKLDQYTDIVCIVPLNTSPFENVMYEPLRPLTIQTSGFAQLQFRLTDKNNRLIDLNGGDWEMLIEIN